MRCGRLAQRHDCRALDSRRRFDRCSRVLPLAWRILSKHALMPQSISWPWSCRKACARAQVGVAARGPLCAAAAAAARRPGGWRPAYCAAGPSRASSPPKAGRPRYRPRRLASLWGGWCAAGCRWTARAGKAACAALGPARRAIISDPEAGWPSVRSGVRALQLPFSVFGQSRAFLVGLFSSARPAAALGAG